MNLITFLLLAFATYYIITALFDYNVFWYDKIKEFMDFKPFICPFCLAFWVGMVLTAVIFLYPKLYSFLIPLAIGGLCDVMQRAAHLEFVVSQDETQSHENQTGRPEE